MNRFNAGDVAHMEVNEADAAALNRLMAVNGCESFTDLVRHLMKESRVSVDVVAASRLRSVRRIRVGDGQIFVRSTLQGCDEVHTEIDGVERVLYDPGSDSNAVNLVRTETHVRLILSDQNEL